MSSFSSILQSLGGQQQQGAQQGPAKQPASSASRLQINGQRAQSSSNVANGAKLTPNNAAAGVKRKSAEPEIAASAKTARTTPAGSASSRFQLAPKAVSQQRPATTAATSSPGPRQPTSSSQRPSSATPTSSATTNAAPAPKRGYLAALERGKAAHQATAKTASTPTYKNEPTKRIPTKRERERMKAEAKAQQRAGGKSLVDRSRSNTPLTGRAGAAAAAAPLPKKVPKPELSYKGTMKSASAPAEPARPSTQSKAKPASSRSRINEYADWDELDEVDDYGEEDEDEGGYVSDASSDMEGGFDDVQKEEMMSRKLAQKEDEEALAEEERLKREKEARRRRLAQMNSAAAAGRKRY
ncbi:uncharacterized protein LTR77_001586 [Saxophila tyrrhenica]|uniref:SPT2 chromatin protein n=1 Tax=Saxophila tyrrhenica TaxID=1690608 RepID=A0AAV9PNZ3_9PEZI|nr:hypothetical protein LTR77_001586 [Saxophila tyrrhenica]